MPTTPTMARAPPAFIETLANGIAPTSNAIDPISR
jgi:hypothetical protein